MNVKAIKSVLKTAKRWSLKHSPELLTALGISGMVGAIYTAVKETPKAQQRIAEAEEAKGEELTFVEKTKATWKVYVPTVVMAGVSIACIVGGTSVNLKRNTALATAYTLAEQSVNELQDKYTDLKKKVHEQKDISEEAPKAQEKTASKQEPAMTSELVIQRTGEELFMDGFCTGTFSSTKAKIENAVANLNRDMMNSIDGSLSLNEYLWALNGRSSDIGECVGWNVQTGVIDISFEPTTDTEGRLVWKIKHHNLPIHNYM